ncbi:MAG: TRAP transporter small permease [Anaerotignum sp.]|nr:TRAP transporter small permease [Anaerotignum sp.]
MKEQNSGLWAKFRQYPPEAYIIGIIMAYTTVVMIVEVIGRYLFAHSFSWSEELVRYSFAWFTMLGASYAVREKANICVDGLLKKLPEKLANVIELFGELLCVAFMLYLTSTAAKYTMFIYNGGSLASATRIPMAYVYASVPVGFLLISLRMAADIVKRLFLKNKKGGELV